MTNNSIFKENTQQPTATLEVKKPLEMAPVVSASKDKIKTGDVESKWFVNLIAFKNQADAKSKIAKFLEKGIHAKVNEVKVGDTTWYQINIGGFKDKDTANSYAGKVKKSLNLNAVSVGKI